MTDLKSLFAKIYARQFAVADAREFIKKSYYFAGTHADVHIVLSVMKPADYHFQDVPKYEERSLHTMFLSMEDAANAVASALNCRAGESALRFLSLSSVNRIALYSRSGAQKAEGMIVRSAVTSLGRRTGTMYGQEKTDIVVVVLSIYNGAFVLTTAYPALMLPKDVPEPPQGHDLLEYSKQYYLHPSA